MRKMAVIALLALCGCDKTTMDRAAVALNPEIGAQNNYERSTRDYRNCIAARPASGCEGQRHMMEADARILASYRPAVVVAR